MKRAITFFLSCFILGITLIACKPVDVPLREYYSHYVFINNTNNTIRIVAYYQGSPLPAIKIPPSQDYHHTVKVEGGFAKGPFMDYSLLEIDNGKVMIIQHSYEELFQWYAYDLVYKREYECEYSFVFTDNFFEDGEFIEK